MFIKGRTKIINTDLYRVIYFGEYKHKYGVFLFNNENDDAALFEYDEESLEAQKMFDNIFDMMRNGIQYTTLEEIKIWKIKK